MAGNLSIAITAETADLTAKLALAQANLRAFSSETRQFAEQIRAAGAAATGEMRGGLEAAAAGAARAKAGVAAVNAELKALSPSNVKSLRQELEGLASPLSGAVGLLTKLGALIGVGLGVEALVRTVTDVANLGHKLTELSDATGLSVEQLSALKYAADITGKSFEIFDRLLPRFGSNLQTSLQTPSGNAARALRALGISEDFVRQHSNDAALMLETVAQRIFALGPGLNRAAIEAGIFGQRMGPELTPILRELANEGFGGLIAKAKEAGVAMDRDAAAKAEAAYRNFREFDAAVRGLSQAFGTSLLPALTLVAKALTDILEKTDHWAVSFQRAIGKGLETQLAEALARIATEQKNILALNERLAHPSWLDRNIGGVKTLQAQLAVAVENLQKFQAEAQFIKDQIAAANAPPPTGAPAGGPAPPMGGGPQAATELEKFRTRLAQMEADSTRTHHEMLAEAVRMWQGEVDSGRLAGKELEAAQRELANATRALNQDTLRESQAIGRQDADTDLQISKLKIAQKKAELEEELAAHRITAQQKLDILRNLTEEEYQLDLKRLQDELATLAQDPVAYDRVYNQIRVLKARLNSDLAALDRQASAEAQKEANQQLAAWKGMISEITSFEQGFVQELISGRQRLSVSLIQLSAQALERELSNDLKAFTTRLFYTQAELAADKTAAEGGILWHLLAEQRKTAATVAGTGVRRAADASENTSFIGLIGQALARWLGLESGKTEATVAGAAERKIVYTAEQIASHAAAVAMGFSQIQIEAAIAAAAAFADSASLGPEGLAAAPGVAAAAYSATLGWAAGLGGGIAGLDVGAWNIPAVMPAILHPGEMVIPQPFASGLRAGDGGALAAGGDTVGGDIHIHGPLVQAIDTQTGANFLQRNVRTIAAMLVREMRDGRFGALANPGLRTRP